MRKAAWKDLDPGGKRHCVRFETLSQGKKKERKKEKRQRNWNLIMRKPDIFDEIIQCLRDTGVFSPSASVSPEILDDLFSPSPSRLSSSLSSSPSFSSSARSSSSPFPSSSRPGQKKPAADPVTIALPRKSGTNAARQGFGSAFSSCPPPPPPPQPGDAAAASGDSSGGRPTDGGWEALSAEVSSCRKCPLHAARTHVVFGEGNPDAELMFIGEGPGADEDRLGRPFVGRAGELLTKMIHAMQFNREEVYIANIVKCRPPNNRVPEESEAALCMPYLERQIELVNPRVMVLLGATPVKYITGLTGITKLRGRWLEYRGIKVMPTFHPAYLLRNPPAKAPVWQDLQMVMKEFGKTFPGKGKK